YSFFFFSSRRRHTRSKRDWSSDVCSSDLPSAILRRPFASRLAFSSCSLVRPKRRSRSRYQAIAASSCAASKSGHSVGVKYSSVRLEERRVGKEGRARGAREE